VPGAQPDPGGRQVPVDEQRGAGVGLTDAVGRGQAPEVVAVGPRPEVELQALAVGGDALHLFLAEHGAKVVQRGSVTDARPEQARAVVGDDRLGALAAEAVGDLAEVLKHRQQLHALARWGGGDLIEVWQRRDAGGLVEAQQQRRVDRPAGARRALERVGHDVGDQRGEQPAQASLVVRRRGEIQGVAAGQQPVRVDRAGGRGGGGDPRPRRVPPTPEQVFVLWWVDVRAVGHSSGVWAAGARMLPLWADLLF
jgi:hypothetical protein